MSIDEIKTKLNTYCDSYLEKLKLCPEGFFLLRGYFYEIPTIQKFTHNLKLRKPKNMPLDIHKKINEMCLSKYDWPIRNGVFTYGFDILNNKPKDLGYGNFYLFFPIGEFEFAYHRNYFDLFGVINNLKTPLDDFISSLEYETKDFSLVMSTNINFDNFANETSIKVKNYYLVNPQFAIELSKMIWG